MVKTYEGHEDGAGEFIWKAFCQSNQINFHTYGRELIDFYDKSTKIIIMGYSMGSSLTAEKGNTVLLNKNKAKAELAGVHVISNEKQSATMFIIDYSNISMKVFEKKTIEAMHFIRY
jgi:CRISPR/Cas system CSM-associated protein Csm4 (group 5 of RAMP superfamily)